MLRQLVEDYRLLCELGDTRLHPDEITTTRNNTGITRPNIVTNNVSSHVDYRGAARASRKKCMMIIQV